jgi:hypothetical protein
MDRSQLAGFRTRPGGAAPEDAGLPRGHPRRTGGLRRDEVAALRGMSAGQSTARRRQDAQGAVREFFSALEGS